MSPSPASTCPTPSVPHGLLGPPEVESEVDLPPNHALRSSEDPVGDRGQAAGPLTQTESTRGLRPQPSCSRSVANPDARALVAVVLPHD